MTSVSFLVTGIISFITVTTVGVILILVIRWRNKRDEKQLFLDDNPVDGDTGEEYEMNEM